jgi:exosortase K
MNRPQLAAAVIAVAVVIAGKTAYRDASADELAMFLAPTARAVSFATGARFDREPAGWVDRNDRFVIAPACAGVHFALAAWLALVIGWLGAIASWRDLARRLALAVGIAYVATLAVNTVRIVVAIQLHEGDLDAMHELEGTAVYLGGLIAVCALARQPRGRWLGVPLAAYLAITLALPLANGAASRPGFAQHALVVIGACMVAIGLGWMWNTARRSRVRGEA